MLNLQVALFYTNPGRSIVWLMSIVSCAHRVIPSPRPE